MGKTNHTPGPWTVAPRHEDADQWDCVDIMAGKYNVAAAIYDGNFYDDEYCDDDLYLPVVDANARLIAAAPELLEAIKRIVVLEVGLVSKYPFLAAVLAKAEDHTDE
jgi:hypothetical protein